MKISFLKPFLLVAFASTQISMVYGQPSLDHRDHRRISKAFPSDSIADQHCENQFGSGSYFHSLRKIDGEYYTRCYDYDEGRYRLFIANLTCKYQYGGNWLPVKSRPYRCVKANY